MAAEYPAGGALPVAATAAIGLFDVRVCPLSAKLKFGAKDAAEAKWRQKISASGLSAAAAVRARLCGSVRGRR